MGVFILQSELKLDNMSQWHHNDNLLYNSKKNSLLLAYLLATFPLHYLKIWWVMSSSFSRKAHNLNWWSVLHDDMIVTHFIVNHPHSQPLCGIQMSAKLSCQIGKNIIQIGGHNLDLWSVQHDDNDSFYSLWCIITLIYCMKQTTLWHTNETWVQTELNEEK